MDKTPTVREPKTRLHYIGVVLALVVLCGAGVHYLQACDRQLGRNWTARQSGSVTESGTKNTWAESLELQGVPNFHKVSDNLYRGAQPSAEGFKQLKKFGIKTIINLRAFHSDRGKIGDTSLAYEHISMEAWDAKESHAVRFLQIVGDKQNAPVFVHCKHGSDRTGAMCAVYRVAIEGWSKSEAIKEMTRGGFGFHSIWQNLIAYIGELDVDKVKDLARQKE